MEETKVTKRKYKKRNGNQGSGRKLWNSPQVDGPSRRLENTDTWGPEREDWLIVAGLYSTEQNGSTSYFSRGIPRVNLTRCFDFKSKTLELLIVPDPYNDNGSPDMYLYMRPYQYNRGKE